jgi:hypothetical protein
MKERVCSIIIYLNRARYKIYDLAYLLPEIDSNKGKGVNYLGNKSDKKKRGMGGVAFTPGTEA